MADEDFQSRVERIFGSLAFSRSSASSTTTSTSSAAAPLRQTQSGSVWSLSGAEVEKREWKRESYDREETPCASSFDEIMRQQRISRTDARKEEGEEGGNEDFDEDWSIRASIGLDRTLDDEEEEDEYDKVALGKEDGGEGLSMEDAVSKPSGVRIRDPRANHAAAKIRLKEDELEANKFSPSGDHSSKSRENPHAEESSEAVKPKPILKRKEGSSDSEARTDKRVRFDVVSEETSKKPEDTCSVSASLKSALHQGKSDAQVPDYLMNPSKYTCYSFDPSSELDEKSQAQEYTDSPKDSEGLESSESESFKKVSFVPQKKTKDVREDGSNCSETKPVVAGQVGEDERPSETEDGDTVDETDV
ncbi:unnamed protein product [Eruca vesicaria subsp. sativa]|uniref:Protein TSSC4 n=1 Tax=Eruca vesicaria subsp. sativa TaxID=29727 RepID=A0ABC8JHP4_ERUVS|nr:unnamed protein product [Eruca vesicaria subsp. sativa]